MDNATHPVVKDLVLIGGGHSHVAVLKRFGMNPMPGVRITVIARDVHTPYSGMLPGFVAGHYGFDDVHIDLEPLARFAGARLYHDRAVGIDTAAKRVLCADRPPVVYDVLSINIGSTPRTADVPGAAEHTVPVKPINRFIARWEALRERVLNGAGRTRIGVVGAGAGGVEVLLAIRHGLHRALAAEGRNGDALEFHLVSGTDGVLPANNAATQRAFAGVLRDRGVTLHAGRPVSAVTADGVKLDNGSAVELDEILWVTSAGAAPWLGETGLAVDDDGFIQVDATLRSVSHPDVFAVGDIAHVVDHPRPKAGVFAVRQGPPLTDNLRRALTGRPAKTFRPQREFLTIISTGDRYAVAARGPWAVHGAWVWRWKDFIDRRFMAKFSDLPEMDQKTATPLAPGVADADAIKELSAIAMRCGGCGAKVGHTVLSRALAGLEPVARNDVLVGLAEPDDAAVVEVPPGKVMVHTVDFFRAIVDDPYLFGRIAANHSLGDIFAMGGEPQTALAIATVPFGVEAKVEDTLAQLLEGATLALREAGAALVGGHTGEGSELALGFAVNGLADREAVMRKGGLRPGDRLILTKPVGTGTLFAADMRLKAKGRWIAGALGSMLQSNRDAAQCLYRFGARACTDVTGFGLLGHLVEMTKPSGTDAVLDLGAIPLLDGAAETVAAGIFSSLQPQNLRLRRAVRDLEQVSKDPRFPLVFDPQTAGGLLAGVAADAAEDCVAELRRLGYHRAAVIGTVEASGNAMEPVSLKL